MRGDAVDGEQPAERRADGLGSGEDVAETAVETEGDEHADGQEGDELDDRLEGDRRDHALVAFARIDVARAEQDREGRHRERHVEFGVLQDATSPAGPFGITMSGYWNRIEKLVEIAFSCSEIYGRMPTTAMMLTTLPSAKLLP